MASKNKEKEPKTFDDSDMKGDKSVPKSDPMTYRNYQPEIQTKFPAKLHIKEVKFADKSVGYDMNQIQWCCPEMLKAVTNDGSSIALYPQGLVLRQADMRNAPILKACPYCGKKIEHEAY